MRELTKKIKVYNKNGDYLAYFDSEPPSNPYNRINMMINPNVSVESNGASTFTFQISVYSRKWMDIFDPENKYIVDGREYICLNEDGIQIDDDLVSVTAYESWKLLEKKYVQAYNVPKEEEFIDDQTVCLLPKSTEPLVVNGVTYTNNPYPRGSAGYNLWALLQGSGWSLKFCDVIVDGFNPAEDYGVFNIETDQKDLLYNLEYVRELYGGIFEWDSINKTLSLHDSDKWDTNYGFEIRKGKNLQSLSIVHDNDIITRLYPLGEGNLNIAAVNGGKRYVENFSYTNAIYERNLSNADIYDQKQLKFWGEKELAKLCKPRKNVTANIVDVRTVPGKEYETFDINDIATVVYTEGDQKKLVKEQLRIISWSYNVFAPYEMTLELGDKRKDAVDYLKQAYDAGNASDEIIDSNGDISIDCIWDSEYGGYFKDGVYDYITQTEHRLEIKIDDVEGSLADFIVEANETFATIEALVQFETETTQAIAGLKAYADDTFATVVSLAEFKTQTSQALTRIEQYVDDEVAKINLRAEYIEQDLDKTNRHVAEIELIANNNTSQIRLKADKTYVDSEILEVNGTVKGLRGDFDNLSVRYNITAQTVDVHHANFRALVAGTGEFGKLLAYKAEIPTLISKHMTTDFLKGKNIQCSGLDASSGNVSGGAANFGSCTVRGNLNIHTLNYDTIKWKRITIPGVGAYNFWIV